jgi:hypothetical protein
MFSIRTAGRMHFNPYATRSVTFMHDAPVPFPFPLLFTVSDNLHPRRHYLTCAIDADIVCSRAKNHFDPAINLDVSDTATDDSRGSSGRDLEAFEKAYKQVTGPIAQRMYFMVSHYCTFRATMLLISPLRSNATFDYFCVALIACLLLNSLFPPLIRLLLKLSLCNCVLWMYYTVNVQEMHNKTWYSGYTFSRFVVSIIY